MLTNTNPIFVHSIWTRAISARSCREVPSSEMDRKIYDTSIYGQSRPFTAHLEKMLA